MRKTAGVLLLFLSATNLLAQQKDSGQQGFEFVLNVTNAISRFTGNGVKNLNEDPYLLAVKYRNKRNTGAWRLGINQLYSKQTTQLFPGERRTRDGYIAPLAGYEWRRHLDPHFMAYWGLDARLGFRNGSVEVFDATSSLVYLISSVENSYGAGPHFGFTWKITPRVYLYTEANLYFMYTSTYRKQDDGINVTVLEDRKRYTVAPVIPTSLFFSLCFK